MLALTVGLARLLPATSAPGAPGRFRVLIDGKPLPTTFGTEGAEWHWQDGGTIKVAGKKIAVGLHDLTGFDDGCGEVIFSADGKFNPPADGAGLSANSRMRTCPQTSSQSL